MINIEHDKKNYLVKVKVELPLREARGAKVKYLTDDIIQVLKERGFRDFTALKHAAVHNCSKNSLSGEWIFELKRPKKTTAELNSNELKPSAEPVKVKSPPVKKSTNRRRSIKKKEE